MPLAVHYTVLLAFIRDDEDQKLFKIFTQFERCCGSNASNFNASMTFIVKRDTHTHILCSACRTYLISSNFYR